MQPRFRPPRLDTGVVCNADGSEIRTDGRRLARFQLENGRTASVEFQVMNVKRCIVSIGRLIQQGFRIDFENQTLTGPHGRQAQVDRQRRLCYLRAHLRESGQTTQENPVWIDTQEHEHEMDGHAKDTENDTANEVFYSTTSSTSPSTPSSISTSSIPLSLLPPFLPHMRQTKKN